MKLRILALSAIFSLCLAGTATSGGRGITLTPGGRTLAGPGSVVVGAGATVVVADGIGDKICATVANRAKAGSVLLELVGVSTDSLTVKVGQTVALCMDNTDAVQVTCQGAKACAVDWRVDSQ